METANASGATCSDFTDSEPKAVCCSSAAVNQKRDQIVFSTPKSDETKNESAQNAAVDGVICIARRHSSVNAILFAWPRNKIYIATARAARLPRFLFGTKH